MTGGPAIRKDKEALQLSAYHGSENVLSTGKTLAIIFHLTCNITCDDVVRVLL